MSNTRVQKDASAGESAYLRIVAGVPDEFEDGCQDGKREADQQNDEYSADVANAEGVRFPLFVLFISATR